MVPHVFKRFQRVRNKITTFTSIELPGILRTNALQSGHTENN
jgi:hypothetical protein